MSETVLPNDEVQSAPEAPEQTPAAAAKRGGNGLAILALLLGAAGVAVGAGAYGKYVSFKAPIRPRANTCKR